MQNVLSIIGTRPDAIKMAPVVRELQRRPKDFRASVCVTAQHREMLDQVLSLFEITPDSDLNLMEKQQTLASLTSRGMDAVTKLLKKERPDLILVQGDTSTAMVAALAAFYEKIPIGHVEAGLRTHNISSPFPEEVNRRVIDVMSTYHFAPTATSADALCREGAPESSVTVTGNTVVDAFLWMCSKAPSAPVKKLLNALGLPLHSPRLPQTTEVARQPDSGPRLVLVTAHRRENLGEPLQNICKAILAIVRSNPDVHVVYPVHLNPLVQKPVRRLLQGQDRVTLLDPLDYEAFVHVMARAYMVLTDSGGVQEEAPVLGIPVLVMRSETERPEAVEAGTVKVVGTEKASIAGEAQRLLDDREAYQAMARAVSPYGDGHAAERIVNILAAQQPPAQGTGG